MSEQVSAELVPGGSVELFLVRFFVVTTQHSKQREATESSERFDGCTLILQHLKQQPEVMGEGRLLGQQKQKPCFEAFFRGLLEIEASAVFLEDREIHHGPGGPQIAVGDA